LGTKGNFKQNGLSTSNALLETVLS